MSRADSMAMMLRSLRLPSIQREYGNMADQAESANWGFEQYLKVLLELEVNERAERRIERLLKRSGLPEGKSLATLDHKLMPVKVRRQIPVLVEGSFVERAENVLAFGLPGRGKTHLLAAIARELVVQRGHAVLFISTHRLVEQLLIAKRELAIEKMLKKLDRFDVVVLDDIGYVQQSREEMEVLFTFLSERYERRSLMITSNLVFSEWDRIFKDPMTTAAAIDRLVHHSTILELNNDSRAGSRNLNSPISG
ncbi:MAG TPA: AAA family ATPase [Phycisphaerales bacterium]|nr:AAA family ATPase [Phycisphaerales bacterium]